jgi:hypothetical protein
VHVKEVERVRVQASQRETWVMSTLRPPVRLMNCSGEVKSVQPAETRGQTRN